jgi:phospholipid/cholesterol/gamma-HCH transport system substrate-binding protein
VKVSDESKVGVFTVISIVILILGYNFLKGKDLFVRKDIYYAYFENIRGLKESNPVTLNGFTIGKVEKLEIIQNSNDVKILARFSVKKKVNIPVNSLAVIKSELMGSTGIDIELGDTNAYFASYDTMHGRTQISIEEAVDNVVKPITEKLNRIMKQMENILDEEGTNNLQKTLKNLSETIENINDITGRMDSLKIAKRLNNIAIHVESITKNLKNNNETINSFISNMESISDTIKAAELGVVIRESKDLITELTGLTKKIKDGKVRSVSW